MYSWKRSWSVGGVILAAASFAQAAPVLIDDFNVAQTTDRQNVGSTTNSVSDAGILGTHRDVTVTVTVASASDPDALVTVGPENLQSSTASGVQGRFAVVWDGSATVSGDPVTGLPSVFALGGVDLTGGGMNDGIYIRGFADLQPTLTVYLFEDATNYSTQSQSFVGLNNEQLFGFLFADFIAVGAGANAASVEAVAIVVSFETAQLAGADVTLDFVEANFVPAPAALHGGLALLALLGVVTRRRRR